MAAIMISLFSLYYLRVSYKGGSDSIASVYNAGDLGSIPVSGRFPYCLENQVDRGAW